jgi:AcrR family transcriptional regulator
MARTTQAAGKTAAKKSRTNDPARTRADILEVATRIFARDGFSGARVDEIAEQTDTSKRMIYYYFRDKEGLYCAVLERAYLGIRRLERELDTETIDPVEAIAAIAGFTFDYQAEHPEFARLVQVENIHGARHLQMMPNIRAHNAPVIAHLARLLQRGERSGAFRAGLDPVDLHWLMSALATFNVANEATFSYLYQQDGRTPDGRAHRRALIVDTVLRWCRADPLPPQ